MSCAFRSFFYYLLLVPLLVLCQGCAEGDNVDTEEGLPGNDSSSPTTGFQLLYDGNGSHGGQVPTNSTGYSSGETATVVANTGQLTRTGHTFQEWNTAADGSGVTLTNGSSVTFSDASITLYAQWERSRSSHNWKFGSGCHLGWDTSAGSTNFTSDPAINTAEGSAAISDPWTGATLMYTDGVSAWDGSSVLVTSGLSGHSSSQNSAVFAPIAGASRDAFLFTHASNQNLFRGVSKI